MAYPFSEGYWQGLMPPIKRRKPWWDKSPSGSYYYPSRPSMSGLPPLGDMPGFAPAQTPQTPMAKKKGLGINDWMDAFSELKPYTPKPGSASARGVGSNTLAKFTPIPGLNPNYDWSYGGLDFDPLKIQKKMMGSLV